MKIDKNQNKEVSNEKESSYKSNKGGGMFNCKFKRIAKKLGLKDIGKTTIGNKTCQECGTELRFGKDKRDYTLSYCPNCQKIIATVFIPRFEPTIIVPPHDD